MGTDRVLVFSRTTGFRHDSIPAGTAAVTRLGAEHGFAVDATEDTAVFTPDGLGRYRAVVFLSPSGPLFDNAERAALESYVRGGGGFAGVHAASTAEPDWPFYAELVGARFRSHPPVQRARMRVCDPDHPATAHLGSGTWEHTDEWYDYTRAPDPRVRVLLTVDESSYTGGLMGEPHPIAWYRPLDAGRSFYTALGHGSECYADPVFLAHLLGGIRYVMER